MNYKWIKEYKIAISFIFGAFLVGVAAAGFTGALVGIGVAFMLVAFVYAIESDLN